MIKISTIILFFCIISLFSSNLCDSMGTWVETACNGWSCPTWDHCCGTNQRCSYTKETCAVSQCKSGCWSEADSTTRSPRIELVYQCKYNSTEVRTLMTFEDGPHPFYTEQILDSLKNAPGGPKKAVFFVLGMYAFRYPKLIKRMIDEGHFIGVHSYFHTDWQWWPADRAWETTLEFSQAAWEVYEASGAKMYWPILVRAPASRLDAALLKNWADTGYTAVYWDLDPSDARGDIPPAAKLNSLQTGLNLNNSIMLLHDTVEPSARIVPDFMRTVENYQLSPNYKYVITDPMKCFGMSEMYVATAMQVLRDKYWNMPLSQKQYNIAIDAENGKFVQLPENGKNFKINVRYRCPEDCSFIVSLYHNDRKNIGWLGDSGWIEATATNLGEQTLEFSAYGIAKLNNEGKLKGSDPLNSIYTFECLVYKKGDRTKPEPWTLVKVNLQYTYVAVASASRNVVSLAAIILILIAWSWFF